MLGLVKHTGGTEHRYVHSCAFSLALKQLPSYILRCCTAVFHAASGKDVMFSPLNMWLIFKCTFTYALGQGDAKDQIVCASSIKNSTRLHTRSCYISKTEWNSAENKIIKSSGFNRWRKLLQWTAVLVKIMVALLDTPFGVGLDQNKCPKKIRDLMYLSKENHKP